MQKQQQIRCLRKHQKLLKLIEYYSRVAKNSCKYSSFCEKALQYYTSRLNEQLGLYCIPVVSMSGDSVTEFRDYFVKQGYIDDLEFTLATSHQREPYEFDISLLDNFFSVIPDSIDKRDLFIDKGLGLVRPYEDEEGQLSSIIFSILLCYLLNTRFKFGSRDDLLDIKRRGKFFEEGFLRLTVVYNYFDCTTGNLVMWNSKNLLIRIADRFVFSDDLVGRELQHDHDHTPYQDDFEWEDRTI